MFNTRFQLFFISRCVKCFHFEGGTGLNSHYILAKCVYTYIYTHNQALHYEASRYLDFNRPLKVSCGICTKMLANRSFKSGKLRGRTFKDRTCLSSISHRFSIGLRSENLEVKYTPQTRCCVPITIHEPVLLCGRAHYPAERGLSHQGALFPRKAVRGLK